MKNKELQEILRKLPDDAIILHEPTGYELEDVFLAEKTKVITVKDGTVEYIDFINLLF